MKDIKCAILHTDEKLLQQLESYVDQTPFLTLSVKSSSPAEILSAYYRKEVQLLFCGIESDVKKVASFCSFLDSSVLIVFVSSDKDKAFDCFRLNALDFLLDSDPYYVFLESANKAFRYIFHGEDNRILKETNSLQNKSYVYIKSEYRVLRLDFESIDYVESFGDYIKIFCNNRGKPIMSLCSLKRMEEVLPVGEFIRVHRSYIVRKKSISVLENGTIVFDKIRIPIGKSYQKCFQEFLNHLPIA